MAGKGEYRVLEGKDEGRRQLGRPRRRWKDNIKVGLQGVGWGVDFIDLAQYRDTLWAFVIVVMNFRVS